jgi:hypothetical protein
MKIEFKIIEVLNDPSTSFWLKKALEDNLKRDPVDAAIDADILFHLLKEYCDECIKPERSDR